MIEASDKNVAWLCERLYEARRTIDPELRLGEHAVFILLTKGPEDRQRVEAMFIDYFHKKYGNPFNVLKHVCPGVETKTLTRIELADISSSVALMDI